ncbi:MAG: TIGR01777 family oxidoreductase [Anaerolineaceae bacterium]|nr:TIGR01777 family oxidoreductase [Anaerolineaceae bacterium]
MKIMISGGTGLIGQALSEKLIQSGDELIILTRDATGKQDSKNKKYFEWDSKSKEPLIPLMQEVDTVVNLSGENIGTGTWTTTKKDRIINSRISVGNALTQAILDSPKRPEVFLQASGVGYYGSSHTKVFDETYSNGDDFLANVAKQWEASSSQLDSAGIRRVIIRNGLVLDSKSGVLPLMVLPFRLFVGGPLGSGRQMVSWIHLQDNIRAIEFLIKNKDLSGPFNLSSPNSLTNAEFGKVIAKVVKRPYWFPVPSFGLKIVLGEKSQLVLTGQNAYPGNLLSHGFEFNFPELTEALNDIYNK